MTEIEIESYRKRLLALLRSLDHEMALLQDEVSRGEKLPEIPLHVADLGTHQFEEQLALDLMGSERHAVTEVVDALNPIAEGKFGRCESCGKEVGDDRLRTMPYARRCAACAREVPKEHPG